MKLCDWPARATDKAILCHDWTTISMCVRPHFHVQWSRLGETEAESRNTRAAGHATDLFYQQSGIKKGKKLASCSSIFSVIVETVLVFSRSVHSTWAHLIFIIYPDGYWDPSAVHVGKGRMVWKGREGKRCDGVCACEGKRLYCVVNTAIV